MRIDALLLGATLAIAIGPTHATAATAAPATATPAAVPTFTIFGWVSPPVPYSDADRWAEMAGAGMNAAVLAWDDPQERGENLRRLDLAAAVGIRCLIADHRFERVSSLGIETPEAGVVLDSIVADYRDHPGFLGYYLGDEPTSASWDVLGRVFAQLRTRDPDHPAWNNLSGLGGLGDSAHWVANSVGYLDHVRPAVLCNDHYDFRFGFDYGVFVENIAGLRAWSLERGIPFWSIVQLIPHLNVRPITEAELAWQVSMLLAYGARGVGYFTYWTPAPDPLIDWGPAIITYDGVRTSWYDVVAHLNQRVRPAGETLARLTWISTQHAGSVPHGGQAFRGDDWLAAVDGRAAIGRFTDAAGVPYLLVVNSDSLTPRPVTLALVGASGASRLATAPGDWSPLRVSELVPGVSVRLDLAAGEFALLRLEGTFQHRLVVGPTLAVVPSPASGEARFDMTRLAGEARLEVLDLSGRRVWSRTVPAGSASFLWRGERDAGGTAAPGVYLARVHDTRGTTTRRWTWLGAR